MALVDLETLAVEPYESGSRWGDFGPYELRRGVARFAVDPTASANATITDLQHAELDPTTGLVRLEADFRILRPLGNHFRRLLFVVSNRGGVGSLPMSAELSTRWAEPSDAIEPGDGFALRRGWTVVWCGWQCDVMRGPGALGLAAPSAVSGGAPIAGQMRLEFRSDITLADHPLCDSSLRFQFAPYPTTDVNDEHAELTVRDWPDGPRLPIDRHRWRFAHDDGGRPVPDDEHVWLEGGFDPHRYYELVYRTRSCPVVGAGLLAIRDFVSFLRYDRTDQNVCAQTIDDAIGFGISQSGRLLREFLLSAMNIDESGRVVFDGVLAHIAGSRRGEFNQRYGQPSLTYVPSFGHLPPFSAAAAPGAETGGLLDRLRMLGGVPKLFCTNSSFEYWRSDAALLHIDPATGKDLPAVPEVREYLFTGVDHIGAADAFKAVMPLANAPNPLDATLLLRAAFANLEAWVCDGQAPPPSRVPSMADGTAVRREDALAQLAAVVPGLHRPGQHVLSTSRPLDLGPDAHRGIGRWPAVAGAALPAFVSAVDADGNEVAGVLLPAVQVPVGTFTGWNPRQAVAGLPDVPYEFVGSWLPFAPTTVVAGVAPETLAHTDPRPAISVRYAGREDYVGRARHAAEALVAERLLLAADVEMAVHAAVALYDIAVSSVLPASASHLG